VKLSRSGFHLSKEYSRQHIQYLFVHHKVQILIIGRAVYW
jgi:hypothetical protein